MSEWVWSEDATRAMRVIATFTTLRDFERGRVTKVLVLNKQGLANGKRTTVD